jgi:hypothetical protein
MRAAIPSILGADGGRASRACRAPGGDRMDLVYVALVLGLFGLSWAFVVLCERL